MKVSDMMTRGVISLAPNDTMLKAARLSEGQQPVGELDGGLDAVPRA